MSNDYPMTGASAITSPTLRLGLMHGDGIGHEIVPVARQIVDAAMSAVHAPPVDWVELPLGREAIETHGTPIPDKTVVALEQLPGWILGPHDSASYPSEFRGQLTPGGVIRKKFELFANIRPAIAFEGVKALVPTMDLVIVRENTEGLYADRNMAVGSGEFMPTPDLALAVGVFTRAACERIARTAFTLATRRRNHVTIVHKANVLTLTTGLFRDACLSVATEFPHVVVDDQHVDAMAALLVRRGGDFDVVVTENMFGDILSDLTGELSGSLGSAPSINASETKVMAQAAHGAAPDIAGKNRANPTALLLSSAMMLDWLGESRGDSGLTLAASRITNAVRGTIAAGTATADLGGLASTSQFAEAVFARTVRR
ncbi:3-isopropylmalate dehydrogenase [Rhodococcus sp. OK302]|nr:3-isopropylmalate dehydrogenase [Rhodococcus sp. OK302]